jgi:hypothetical protein
MVREAQPAPPPKEPNARAAEIILRRPLQIYIGGVSALLKAFAHS